MMKLGRKIGKQLLSGILTFSMILSSAITSYAYTEDTPVFPTVASSTEDCVLIGVKGDYITQAQEALERINAIRLEACKEGVLDPRNTKRKLTEADYVPLKWSAGLEMIARIRAAEASLTIGHTRPNGEDCFTLKANGVSDSGEVLAWNYSSSMLPGIEQWYKEKSIWVNQGSGQTGHYTIMINPNNTYVGLGCMITDYKIYPNTTCGRFSSTSASLDVTMDKEVTDCIQLVEAKKSFLTDTTLSQVSSKSASSLKIGDTISYEMIIGTDMGKGQSKALLMDDVKWTSSDEKVATVDTYGKVTRVGFGTVVITATSDSGYTASASLAFTCSHNETEYRGVQERTCTKDGYTGDEYCKDCGEKIASGSIIKATGHQWDDGYITRPTTAGTDGEKLYTCQTCGTTKTETIPATGDSAKNPNSGNKESGNGSNSGNAGNGSEPGAGNAGGTGNENDSNQDTKVPSVSKVKSLKATAGSKKLTITWKKLSGAAGYELQVSTKSNFKGAKIFKISKSKKQYVAKKLKAKKKYYVRVRAYQTYKDANGKTQKAYGKWVKVSKKTK